MRGNVLLRYGLPLLIALPIGFLLLYPQLIHCFRIRSSENFRLLKDIPNVYIHQTATSQQQKQLRQHIVAARNRIRRFWGDQRGQAILIYCPNQSDYEHYCAGGEGAGCSLGMPWGTSYLVLGPDGNNVDVIAHELCHDELFARLGWWRVKRQIPQWFNEGLALMVDYRFSNPTVWETPDSSSHDASVWDETNPTPYPPSPMLKLSELETTRDFFGSNATHTMQAYQTAADEVARWLSIAGRKSVPILADAIAKGNDFGEVYRRLEREHM
ncbi:hypothetical protein GO755_33140 [Spirosoma sp. HMF4905]|uniref:Peptidase MA-like domain-containing protein n=1 Tax=Spirosoma arboris TaxID=2682092 RepID=A0A7K1SM94_9BACT|nr:hypothetical protein [Spirosoma arboris]MVM34921.1 hypothetical protein [Spirosoma arboris]